MSEQRQGNRNSWEVTSPFIRGWESTVAMVGGSLNLKPTPRDTPLPTRPCLLILPKQQPTGDQVLKCLRRMGDISFKPPSPLTLLHSLIPFFLSCPLPSISPFFSVVLTLSSGSCALYILWALPLCGHPLAIGRLYVSWAPIYPHPHSSHVHRIPTISEGLMKTLLRK